MTFEKTLSEAAYEAGFIAAGTIQAQKVQNAYQRLYWLKQNGHFMPFVPQNIKTRTTPSKCEPNKKSIILALYPYGGNPVITPSKPEDNHLRARMARIAWGQDYHSVVDKALEKLALELQEKGYVDTYRLFVDTSPFAEKELAYAAGLGKHGKNNCLIHPQRGSFVLIGGILVDKALPTIQLIKPEQHQSCKSCNICVRACPGQALDGTGMSVDLEKCAAYLTVKKGVVPLNQRPIFNDYLYGCDICQLVCPENSKRALFFQHDLPYWGGRKLNIDELYPKIAHIIELSGKAYKKWFGNNAVYWRGRTVLQRNAFIALGNMETPKGLSLAFQGLEDEREVIRAHAVWAAAKMIQKATFKEKLRLKRWLEKSKKKDTSSLVLDELNHALHNLDMS